MFVNVVISINTTKKFFLVKVICGRCFKYLCFEKMANLNSCHYRNGDCLPDFLEKGCVRHVRCSMVNYNWKCSSILGNLGFCCNSNSTMTHLWSVQNGQFIAPTISNVAAAAGWKITIRHCKTLCLLEWSDKIETTNEVNEYVLVAAALLFIESENKSM